MPNGSISFNPSRASTSNIPTCAVTGSRNICSIGSRWTTLQNTTQRHNSTNLTGSPRDGLPTISAAPRGRRGSAELVTHELITEVRLSRRALKHRQAVHPNAEDYLEVRNKQYC